MLKHTRERYQSGSLTKEKRRSGDVWVFRWREYHADRTSTYRKNVVGPLVELRTKAAAEKAVAGLRLDINVTTSATAVSHTVAELITHYKRHKLQNGDLTARGRQVYLHILDDIITPTWSRYRCRDVRTGPVEDWLNQLPYAPATKTKVKGVFGTLFRHAMRYDMATSNPVTLCKVSGKRMRTPDILTGAEIRGILGELSEPARTVTLLAAITGMRRGELFGLKWEDIDFERRIIRVVRSLVDQIEGQPKTETSRKPLPLSDQLADALSSWRETSDFAASTDWVFASPVSFGKRPYWPDMVLRRHILPAVKRLGIDKRVGWHTFRRSAASLLVSMGASPKTTQELMRHATARTTLELYAQAFPEEKRHAQDKLAEVISSGTHQPGLEEEMGFAA